MPIPFLQPKKVATMILARKGKSDLEVTPEMSVGDEQPNEALKMAMADLLQAIEHKSLIDMCDAFEAAMDAYNGDEPEGPKAA